MRTLGTKPRRLHYSLAAGALTMGALPYAHGATWGDITYTTSGSNWMINNNSIQLTFSTTGSNITRLIVDGHSGDNILDSGNSQIYNELAKSGLDVGTAGPMTSGFNTGISGTTHYLDVYTNTASSATRAFSYQIHYMLFEDDPAIHMYMTVNHSATDIAGSYGQGQFLFRSNTNIFTNTYQYHVSPNDPVNSYAKTATFPEPASTFSSVSGQAGRTVQDATTDLTGSGLPGDWGTNFFTKYDYSSYEQFDQAKVEFGSTGSTNRYAISTIYPNKDTMTGGPTKQNLQYTNTSILMAEYLSGHYATSSGGYAYVPPQGVDSSRLFGPYVFRVTANPGNESGDQLYQDAINTIPTYNALYDQDSSLIGNGYVTAAQRGALQVTVGNTAAGGWSSNSNNNTLVLTDNHVNFQRASSGYQYWTQMGPSGIATITGIVPGTYRLSLYQAGQWGETRYDNIPVTTGQTSIPQNIQFTPENFSTGGNAPIWTLGTPDRSSHEFLNGHDASGLDQRQFYGAYDYWKEMQDMGTPGKVVYYATNVPGHSATNDPNKWIANQWKTFNPGMYDAANSTSDNYSNLAPAYVRDAAHGGTGPGPASYTGSPWEIHFSPTAAQIAQGRYIILSVGLAATEGSLTITLNNGATSSTKVWHGANTSDPMVRSGDAGFYQWIAFQWDNVGGTLLTAGADDYFTFSPSQTDGVMYDALRMEITTMSADPSQAGWQWKDYEFINSNGSTNAASANEAAALSTTVTFAPEPASALLILGGIPLLLRRKRG